ncbi:MAG: septum formation protein Maf [Spirochaetae bacterium HGW-Spirochaetae-7]|jgi:septum formation protein|nr:MAG: septum formation protein Maf [Spirochaetae bacterium HGW-Spirochaetae-7]
MMEPAKQARPLLLASASPRRIEMLERLGFELTIAPADIDESVCDDLPIGERVVKLAELKARAGSAAAGYPPIWALGADTLVSLDGIAMGKPAGEVEAREMLSALSGRTHRVTTGICVLDRRSGEAHTAVSESSVHFSPLGEEELDGYLATGEWRGAAGAYRIQEHASYFVEWLEGSFSGVVGLPLHEFYAILSAIGYPFPFGLAAVSTSR